MNERNLKKKYVFRLWIVNLKILFIDPGGDRAPRHIIMMVDDFPVYAGRRSRKQDS